MSYEKHNFKSGQKLYASQLNEMDEQIFSIDEKIGESTYSDIEHQVSTNIEKGYYVRTSNPKLTLNDGYRSIVFNIPDEAIKVKISAVLGNDPSFCACIYVDDFGSFVGASEPNNYNENHVVTDAIYDIPNGAKKAIVTTRYESVHPIPLASYYTSQESATTGSILERIINTENQAKEISDEVQESLTQETIWVNLNESSETLGMTLVGNGNIVYIFNSEYYRTRVYDVEAGEVLRITTAVKKGSDFALAFYTNDSKKLILKEKTNDTGGNVVYTNEESVVPTGATKLYVTTLIEVRKYQSVIKATLEGTIKERLKSCETKINPINDSFENRFKGKTVVNFGDSIYGNKRPPEDVSTGLATLLCAEVVNGGFGGCRMSQHYNANFNKFSMCEIADSIQSGSWTAQESVVNSSDLPTYFSTTLGWLKNVDFSKVSAITIGYGTNDYLGDVTIDNDSNKYDKSTMCGALRYSIEKILTTFPNIEIFICSTTYHFNMSNGEWSSDTDTITRTNGKKMSDYNDGLRSVASEYHLKFIDNYNDLGINKFNRSHYFPTNDGTHHNMIGGRLIAKHIASEMF